MDNKTIQTTYICASCDGDMDPGRNSLYCSDECEREFNEDLGIDVVELVRYLKRAADQVTGNGVTE